MESIGQVERVTQNRVVKFFQNKLGYDYFGDWQVRENNKNLEEDLFATWLSKQSLIEPLGYEDWKY